MQFELMGLRNFICNIKARWAKKRRKREADKLAFAIETMNDDERLTDTFVYNAGRWIEHVEENGGNKVIGLITHGDDYTGAPIALSNMALFLRELGYYTIWITPVFGPSAQRFNDEGVPVIVTPLRMYDKFVWLVKPFLAGVICNTLVTYEYATEFGRSGKNVLWWIHEAELFYPNGYKDFLPPSMPDNVRIYTVGEYARRILLKYRPGYKCDSLLYYLPDFMAEKNDEPGLSPELRQDKFVFLCVGTIEKRKGQDILLDALERLESRASGKMLFVFVGNFTDDEIFSKLRDYIAKHNDNAVYLTDVPIAKMHAIFKEIDCYVCPSRDDPMPIVVTEAMCASKLIICSENTGSAHLLEKHNAGIVFDGTAEALAELIDRVPEEYHSQDIAEMKNNARGVYDMYFSKDAFSKMAEKIIRF